MNQYSNRSRNKSLIVFSVCSVLLIGMLITTFFMFQIKAEQKPDDLNVTQPIRLTFSANQSAIPPNNTLETLNNKFFNETGISVDISVYNDAQWRDILKAQLASGTAPDIFAMDSDPYSIYEKLHPDVNCIDLSEEEFINRMDPSVLPSLSYNDRVYGITFSDKKIWAYHYNKQIFRDLDLSAPTTYEELKHAAAAIYNTGAVPMWQATASSWHQVLPLLELGPYYASQTDGLYEKLNKNQIKISEVTSMLTVLEQINEFAKLGYYGDYFENDMNSKLLEAFGTGKVAMVLKEVGYAQEVENAYPEMKGNIGVFIMPWADNQIIGVNPTSNAYFVNKNGVYTEEALTYFRFLTRNDNLQERLALDHNLYSLCWPEIESKMPSDLKAYLDEMDTGPVMQVSVSYIDSQWMDVGLDIEQMFVGTLTPADVLNRIDMRRSDMAKLASDPYWDT